MSTSLNVVSIAAVFCASLSRLATVWRRRVIRTRSSRRSPALAGAGSRLRSLGRGRGGRRRGGSAFWLLGGGEHVVLGEAAVLAGALDLRWIEMVLEHDPAHRGRQGQMRPVLVLLLAALGASAFGSIFSPAPSGLTGVDSGSFGSAAASRGAAARLDMRDHRADRDSVADLGQLLAHRPGDRRVDLDRDLVGLEAGDRLVLCDRIAGLLQPGAERRLGDRFAQRRAL